VLSPRSAGSRWRARRLKKVSVGTELDVVLVGIPEVIPVEARNLGWQASLELLARLVEADVPG
jgi:hypothetical protein